MTTDINRIRSFNRFYTQKIGLITSRFLKSDFSLVQARLLYELNHSAPLYATDLARRLDLSPDYLSKALGKFERQGLMTRTPSPDDSRKRVITATQAGREAYEALRETSNAHISKMIGDLSGEERERLLAAMDTIHAILAGEPSGLVTLRSHRPGDIGTVIHRHGVLYAREYGFTHEFDAYVAKGMADFIEGYDSRTDHLWIAETLGRFAGSVAIVGREEGLAQLRWLIVEPRERGKGIGGQLVREAVRFARESGFSRLMLWTIDFLSAARRLYADAGFELTRTKTSQVWGHTLEEERWDLPLG